MKYALSSCLLGKNCKYNGGNNRNEELIDYFVGKDYIEVCPEVLGGLLIPRASCEIVKDKIINSDGQDCTKQFILGAKKALHLLIENQVEIAILQPRSPSCGVGKIYDGSFSNRLVDGNGIFVEMLLKAGILAMTWEEFSSSTLKEP